MSKPYVDEVIESIAAEEEISIAQAKQEFIRRAEHSINIGELPKSEHRWVDRGLKMTCEGGNHPYHEAWKR